DKDIERREIAVQRLPAMQSVEGSQNRSDLASHESLGLRAFAPQPDTEVPVHGVLQRDAIVRASIVDFDESVEDSQRPRLAEQQLGEVCLTQPCRESLGYLDANLPR